MARSPQVFETGQEPDFTVDDIARVERLRDGTVRLYIASEWQGGLKVEYSVRCTKAKLAEFGRMLLHLAAEVHNTDTDEGFMEATAH